MPVRKLSDYLTERKLVTTRPLSTLTGQRIGVDGQSWLKGAVQTEPFHAALGGPPLALESALLVAANRFASLGIRPVFVFHGLAVPRKDAGRGILAQDLRYQKRNSAWNAYYANEIQRAATDFQSSEKNAAGNFVHVVIDVLSRHGHDVLRAPILSWGQLAALERARGVSAVFGGPELLMVGCEHIILSIDWVKQTYDSIDLRRVLEDMGSASPDHLLDMCVLAGFDYSVTFPPLLEGGEFSFMRAREIVQRYRSGLYAVQAHANRPNVARLNYTELFLSARALVRHMTVLDAAGPAALLHIESCPRDMHEVVGTRLPDEVYHLLAHGIIQPQQLNNLVSGVMLEVSPLVDSDEYRTLLGQLLGLRAAALGIIAHELNEFYQQRRVVSVCWYSPEEDVVVDYASHFELFGGWHPRARGSLLEKSTPLSVCDVARRLDDVGKGKRNKSRKPDAKAEAKAVPVLLTAPPATETETPATMIAEAVGAPLVKLLVMREYAEKGGCATVWGRALGLFPSEFGDQAMILLELLRLGMLNGHAFHFVPPRESPSYPGDREVQLLTRVFSVLHANLKPEQWSGPLDHDVLGFNSLVKALHRTLRNVLEAELLARVLRRECTAPVQALTQVAQQLPFHQESGTVLGIVLKHLLLQPDASVAQVAQSFPECVDVAADLKRGVKLWGFLLAAVRALNQRKELHSKVVALFESADEVLKARLGE